MEYVLYSQGSHGLGSGTGQSGKCCDSIVHKVWAHRRLGSLLGWAKI